MTDNKHGVAQRPELTHSLREALTELTGAMRFVLAFYEPSQRHLDTNAWKQAEAGARAAFAKAESALAPQPALEAKCKVMPGWHLCADSCAKVGECLHAPSPALDPDAGTIQTLLDLLNPLHGELDRQTYDEKVRDDFDAPRDKEYSVNITGQMEANLTQAVLILENRKSATSKSPALDPATVEAKHWRCFFCDEVFTDDKAAAHHFGGEICGEPLCKLAQVDGRIAKVIADLAYTLHGFQIEDNASFREFYALGADHWAALIKEEQKGYDRGLADGRALLASPAPSEEPVVPQQIVTANLQEAWAALGMIRETVETLGPVGAMKASEHLDGPTFMHEAEAIVNGIRKIAAPAGIADADICNACWRRKDCGDPDCPNSKNIAMKCAECDRSLADPPSTLCPGCQAYQEHQR